MWIAKLEQMRAWIIVMEGELEDVDLIMHVQNNLPESYDSLVDLLEDELGNTAQPLTVMRMRMKLKAKYLCQKSRNGNSKKDSALTFTADRNEKCYKKSGSNNNRNP